jgi:Domain of unknown function (DUF4893)
MRFLLSLGMGALLAMPSPAATQNLSDRDWRTLAHPSTVEHIERWEEYFALAQGWVAAMNGVSQNHQPTAPFELIPLGHSVLDISAQWTGVRPCRAVYASRSIVVRYDWFRCRLFRSNGQWRIEKITGSIRFEVWLFRDEKFGTVGLGDRWSNIEKRPSRLGDGAALSDVAFVLRYDGANMLRLFDPHPAGYEVLEIDLRR